MRHPNQFVDKLSKKEVFVSVVNDLCFHGRANILIIVYSQYVVICSPLDVRFIFGLGLEIYYLVIHIFLVSRNHRKKLLNIYVFLVESSVECGQTKISKDFQSTNHFPSTLQIKTKTVLRLLVIEIGDPFIPSFQLSVVAKKVVKKEL